MRVAIIGGGVAGAGLAYFLGRLGAEVTLIDAGEATASHVPAALLNPVRGQAGQVDARALSGLRCTWALLGALDAAGHRVPHARSGVLRPVPDDRTRSRFERHLPAELPHRWLAPGNAPAPLAPGWAHVLWLPDGGWVDGQAFTDALIAASGARVRRERALAWTPHEVRTETATLHADAVAFCGGSVGASWASEAGAEAPRTHRMGTLLRLDRAVSDLPLSFGAYLSPAARGGVLGGTFETPAPTWRPPQFPLASLDWLLDKGEALAGLRGTRITGHWTGSRLSGLRAEQDARGVWHLSGLSSKGFLLGPLLASGLAREMTGQASSAVPSRRG